MVKSLYSGVSGLKTHQQRMDVIGNNIANVNTIGNKADVVTFSDVYYQTKRNPSAASSTLGGVNPMQVGYGVKMNSTTANMTQSGYTQSDNTFDMAINGNGFFQVMDSSGNIFYTRAGIFNIDNEGNLVNADGYHVLGVSGDSTGQEAGSQPIKAFIPATEAKASSATKKINGTDVTLSVSAPSDYTNMTVAFQDAEFPYATYANDILTIYFNPNRQYESEQEFEDAINEALQAGGITLPDEVTLQFDFAEIPNDPNSKTAENDITNLIFTTENSTATLDYVYKKNGGGNDHAYMTFIVDSNTSTDAVKINYEKNNGVCTASYDAATKTWTLTMDEDTEISDLQKKIDEILAGDPSIDSLDVAFKCPDKSQRAYAILNYAERTGGTITNPPAGYTAATVAGAAPIQVMGVTEGSVTGAMSVVMHDAGEFANNYKITFAYTQSYDNTKAVWDENTLTVTISPNSSIADVNKAIRDAANGNTQKMMTFTEISGLSDDPIWSASYDSVNSKYVITQTDIYGTTRTAEYTGTNPPTDADVAAITTWDNYVDADGKVLQDKNQFFLGDPTNASGPNGVVGKDEKAKGILWNPGIREEFFSGNPAISPMGGEDAFFTGVAKSLSTFALADGRMGEEQSFKDFTDITVQQDGRIIGLHSIHGYIEIGRIDIAQFDNPNGLAKAGGTTFQATVASGEVKLSVAGQGGAGVILSGSLEMSNVDLAQEFTDMITTQRGYQANSRVITVSDTMLEELLSLKR